MASCPATLESLDPITPAPGVAAAGPTAVVIGNFDGVHRGHQAVLAEAAALAKGRGLEPIVMTFYPHPAGILGRQPPPLLTTLPRRAELVCRHGITRVVAVSFDLRFAAWSPERFARELLRETLAARLVVVGQNFRFGAKRAGDFAELARLGEQLGFEARSHEMAADAKGNYSSTRVREAIRAGDLDEARRVLGRPHALSGVVEHGDARGRTIGFPTANLGDVPEMLPPDGVYAIRVERLTDGASEPLAGGVMNIGVRPTVSGERRRTHEAHLFDFDGDLYGQRLLVHLVARLREERRFAGLEALKAQISLDALAARGALASEPRP